MIKSRRLAFARARTPAVVAMRAIAAALAAFHAEDGARRGVFTGPRNARRVTLRDRSLADAARPPRGCEDLH